LSGIDGVIKEIG